MWKFVSLSVCMPDNINKHRPRIIKFAHNVSYENSLNARFINSDNKIKFTYMKIRVVENILEYNFNITGKLYVSI